MPRRWSSLQIQLPVAAALLLLVVAALLTAEAYHRSRLEGREVAATRLLGVAQRMAVTIGFSIPQAMNDLIASSTDPAVVALFTESGRADTAAAGAVLRRPAGQRPERIHIAAWDLDGGNVLTAVAADTAGGWIGAPPEVEAAQITPIRAVDDQVVYYSLVAPVFVDRRIVGYVQQRQRLGASRATESTVDALLGDPGELLIGSVGGAWSDFARRVPAPDSAVIDASTAIVYERQDIERMGIGRAVAGTPWILVAELPMGTILGPSTAFLWQLGSIALVLVVASTFAAWLLGRAITRPTEALTAATDAIRRGELSHRAPVRGHPELAAVTMAFNEMAAATDSHVRALATSEQRFRSLVTASAQVVWWTDPSGQVVEPSPTWEAFTGQEFHDAQGRGFLEAIHPDDRPHVEQAWAKALEQRTEYHAEYRLRRADGTWRRIISRGLPVHGEDGEIIEWVGTGTDVTRRLEAELALDRKEEELRQAQRLDAIGRLAGGVAHDFNNLLTAMMVPAELAMQDAPRESQLHRDLEEIRDAGLRASQLTRQLLAFGRQQMLTVSVVELDEVVESARRIIRRLIPESIEIAVTLRGGGHHVRVDRTQIEQVIINLAVNARDAMPGGGQLVIETAPAVITALEAELHEGLEPGRYMLLTVTDTGAGMDAATLARVFEPFFTTKAPGQGTGLGLATVYGIVKQSGGSISLESEPGVGTAVRILFPESVTSEAETTDLAAEAPPGEGTILLVEDEPALRRISARMLTRLGYTVLSAGHGDEALAIAAGHDGPIDLLVSDVVMPGMNGLELFHALAAQRPGLPVLFVSGWTGDPVVRDRILHDDVPFLHKPFTLTSLAQKVHDVLVVHAR